MRIINAWPPNFAEIVSVFRGAERPGVVFAYAPDIYSKGAVNLPGSLVAHEMVHIARQEAMGVEAWWDKYLTDTQFRYYEEVLAHRAEYLYLMEKAPSRNVRRSALRQVAKKLSASLYGWNISADKAMRDIQLPLTPQL